MTRYVDEEVIAVCRGGEAKKRWVKHTQRLQVLFGERHSYDVQNEAQQEQSKFLAKKCTFCGEVIMDGKVDITSSTKKHIVCLHMQKRWIFQYKDMKIMQMEKWKRRYNNRQQWENEPPGSQFSPIFLDGWQVRFQLLHLPLMSLCVLLLKEKKRDESR